MPLSELYLKSLDHARLKEISALKTGRVETGHKAFDQAANHPSHGYVGTGNVFSRVQRSSYIRSAKEARSNGQDFPEGHLRKEDLKAFSGSSSSQGRGMFIKHSAEMTVIGYEFLTPAPGGERRPIGWVVTDAYGRLLEARENTTSPVTEKTRAIMRDMISRVSWSDAEMSDPVDTAEIERWAASVDESEIGGLLRSVGYELIETRERAREVGKFLREDEPFMAVKVDGSDVGGLSATSRAELLTLASIAVADEPAAGNPGPKPELRYVISDPERGAGWTHIFEEDGRDADRTVRFVWDREDGRLAAAEVMRDHVWREMSSEEFADLEDSLSNANEEALDDPEGWSLIESDELPGWAGSENDPSP